MAAPVIPANVQVPSLSTAPIVADFASHALRAAYVMARHLTWLPSSEWDCPGVYVMLTGDGKTVYVGQSTKLRGRLLHHRARPPLPWVRAIVIKRDTSHGFNSAEIGYLEGRLSAELSAVAGMHVLKGKVDQDATLPPHMLIALDELLPSMVAAVRLSGIDTHKEADIPENAVQRKGHTQIPGSIADLLARGLLHAGAELHLRQGGRAAIGTVTTQGEVIVAGVAYASPSRAAASALGLQSSNGWAAWHVGSINGPTLAALRTQLDTQDGPESSAV
jgi:hypothetical protein